jgi:hypothetical protein
MEKLSGAEFFRKYSDIIAEASVVNGKTEDPKSLKWKQTSLTKAEAIAKHGKDNVRDGGKAKVGGTTVEVQVPLGPVDEAEEITEAPKCKICNKPQKENTEGNKKYCQGH